MPVWTAGRGAKQSKNDGIVSGSQQLGGLLSSPQFSVAVSCQAFLLWHGTNETTVWTGRIPAETTGQGFLTKVITAAYQNDLPGLGRESTPEFYMSVREELTNQTHFSTTMDLWSSRTCEPLSASRWAFLLMAIQEGSLHSHFMVVVFFLKKKCTLIHMFLSFLRILGECTFWLLWALILWKVFENKACNDIIYFFIC